VTVNFENTDGFKTEFRGERDLIDAAP